MTRSRQVRSTTARSTQIRNKRVRNRQVHSRPAHSYVSASDRPTPDWRSSSGLQPTRGLIFQPAFLFLLNRQNVRCRPKLSIYASFAVLGPQLLSNEFTSRFLIR